jgi:hypothetical protein
MHVYAESEAAESANVVEMWLYTNKLFAKNIRFYLAHGYRIDRAEPYKDGFLTHMSKRIGL